MGRSWTRPSTQVNSSCLGPRHARARRGGSRTSCSRGRSTSPSGSARSIAIPSTTARRSRRRARRRSGAARDRPAHASRRARSRPADRERAHLAPAARGRAARRGHGARALGRPRDGARRGQGDHRRDRAGRRHDRDPQRGGVRRDEPARALRRRSTVLPWTSTFGRPDPFGIVGESEAAWRCASELAFAASTDRHVLLLGESGVGKELAARAMHGLSARREPDVRRAQRGDDARGADRRRAVRQREELSEPGHARAPGPRSARPTARRCSSTRSAICPRRARCTCCACSTPTASTSASARRSTRRSSFRLVAATNRALELAQARLPRALHASHRAAGPRRAPRRHPARARRDPAAHGREAPRDRGAVLRAPHGRARRAAARARSRRAPAAPSVHASRARARAPRVARARHRRRATTSGSRRRSKPSSRDSAESERRCRPSSIATRSRARSPTTAAARRAPRRRSASRIATCCSACSRSTACRSDAEDGDGVMSNASCARRSSSRSRRDDTFPTAVLRPAVRGASRGAARCFIAARPARRTRCSRRSSPRSSITSTIRRGSGASSRRSRPSTSATA